MMSLESYMLNRYNDVELNKDCVIKIKATEKLTRNIIDAKPQMTGIQFQYIIFNKRKFSLLDLMSASANLFLIEKKKKRGLCRPQWVSRIQSLPAWGLRFPISFFDECFLFKMNGMN
jgi:hypothetical protein